MYCCERSYLNHRVSPVMSTSLVPAVILPIGTLNYVYVVGKQAL
jgi:hypothetical protein